MTSIVAAVTPATDRFEGLNGYFLGKHPRATPTAVPHELVPSARLPSARPTDAPSKPSRIPSSSQRPYQLTNQRIPYARHAFVMDAFETQIDAIEPGDILFVHRMMNGTSGHDVNRCTKTVSLAQLNAMLKRTTPYGPGAEDRVQRVRNEAAARARANVKDASHDAAYASKLEEEAERLEKLAADWKDVQKIDTAVDWRAAALLDAFVPDGIAISAETDAASAHDLLVNVCVGGPTPCRNTRAPGSGSEVRTLAAACAHHPTAQIIDDGALVLDSVFVGVFYGDDERFSLKPFTGRQLSRVGKGPATGPAPPGAPASHATGPSGAEFRRLAHAWRIGSIMDTRRVGGFGMTNMLLVNVVVEEYGVKKLNDAYGLERIGTDPRERVLKALRAMRKLFEGFTDEDILDARTSFDKESALRKRYMERIEEVKNNSMFKGEASLDLAPSYMAGDEAVRLKGVLDLVLDDILKAKRAEPA